MKYIATPSFSGSTSNKGFEYNYWRDIVIGLRRSYTDINIIQGIRKAVSGQPAHIIGRLDIDCSLDNILEALNTVYGDVHDESEALQRFYSAEQSNKESIVDWHTRLSSIWSKIPKPGQPNLKIKKRLWVGLKSSALKESSRHIYDDDTISEVKLVKYLRQLEESKSSLSVNTLQVEELQAQVAALQCQVKELIQPARNEKKSFPRVKNSGKPDQNCAREQIQAYPFTPPAQYSYTPPAQYTYTPSSSYPYAPPVTYNQPMEPTHYQLNPYNIHGSHNPQASNTLNTSFNRQNDAPRHTYQHPCPQNYGNNSESNRPHMDDRKRQSNTTHQHLN